MLNSSGSLVLLSQNRTVVWSANSTKEAGSPVVELLDSGNLVLREKNEENRESYLWQSFDYPSDSWLPGMKLGWDLRTGLERRLTAWKSPDDPSPGELSLGIVLHNYPEIVMKNGSKIYCRGGQWNGIRFSGGPGGSKTNPVHNFTSVSNKDELYFMYHTIKKSVITRAVLNQTLYMYERYMWIEADKKWIAYFSAPQDTCDSYNLCGAYGNCIIGYSPICQCLEGFKPKSPERWNPDDWAKGCVRTTELSCKDKDKIGFVKLVGLKLPDTTYSWVNKSLNLSECRVQCLNNCSCMAYSNTDIRDGGSGCAIWYGDLIDIRQVAGGGQDTDWLDVYIRMPASKKGMGLLSWLLFNSYFEMPLSFCWIQQNFDHVKDACQTTVDAGTYTMQKAKEATDELIPYSHQLLYSHPYLKDVIFPIGSNLASTILAWSFMPRLLRRFHKYAMQSHDDFDVQVCNGRTNHYGIIVP
nr:g-type lectin s-receptor-like serine/threonine-protein kinase [Quercus suber]